MADKDQLVGAGLTVGGIIWLMCAVPFGQRQHHPVDNIDLDRLTRRGKDDMADKVVILLRSRVSSLTGPR